MRIRQGFVSNSSSSSFIVLSKPRDFKSINQVDINSGKIHAVGTHLYDGIDIFEVTHDIFTYLKKHPDKLKDLDMSFIEIHNQSEYELVIHDKSSLPDCPFRIESFDLDYHVTENLEEFMERYINKENEDDGV